MEAAREVDLGIVGRPVVALIAHDGMKQAMRQLTREHVATLRACRLIATKSTGTMLTESLGLPIDLVESGPRGGDLQVGSRIASGLIDAVIFLRDPLAAHPHEPDIQALLKICDVHEVPVASNRASGEILLRHLARRAVRAPRIGISHPSFFERGSRPRHTSA